MIEYVLIIGAILFLVGGTKFGKIGGYLMVAAAAVVGLQLVGIDVMSYLPSF